MVTVRDTPSNADLKCVDDGGIDQGLGDQALGNRALHLIGCCNETDNPLQLLLVVFLYVYIYF